MRSDTTGGGGVADLDELERLLAEATPGPWYELSKVDVSCQRDTGYTHGVRSGAIPQRVLLGYPDSPRELTDIRLVLALHNAAPALIAAARREQEARALIAALVEAGFSVFCCRSLPHAPDCVWRNARAWLAGQS